MWGHKSLQQQREEILRKLEHHDFNPFSIDSMNHEASLWGQLSRIDTQIKLEQMRQQGYSIDGATEQAYLDMVQSHTQSMLNGGVGRWDFIAATDRLLGEITRTANSLQNNAPQHTGGGYYHAPMTCGFCNGLGWYVCSGCAGSGRVYSPDMQYTGNRAVDAVIGLANQYNHVCPTCQGHVRLLCPHCGGAGKIG